MRSFLLVWIASLSLTMTSVSAHAQYHAGASECDPYLKHQPSTDIEFKDGFDQHGNAVKPADLEPNNLAKQLENTSTSLDIPITNYIDQDNFNVDLSESEINLGAIEVKKDGTASLNGAPIKQQNIYSTECK